MSGPDGGATRVLQVTTRLNIGGVARHVILLSQELDRRGFPSEIVWGAEEPREGRIEPTGVRHVRIATLKRPVDPLSDARGYLALDRLMRERRPRIVHTHLSKAGVLGRLAALRAGVPVIAHTFHGHVLEGYFPATVSRGFLQMERYLARKTDALIAVSANVRDELLALGVGRPSQWRVVPLGFDLNHLLASPLSQRDARRVLGLDADGPIVGIIGRLVPIKDHMAFLQAAERVAARRPDVRFVVAGDGDLRARLEAAARSLRAQVRFLGWTSDTRALYSALDVVALTSTNEGTPVALIEAAAAAKPVVATDVGGVAAVVRHGATGILVPPRDPQAFAEALLRLLEAPEVARSQGEAGRAFVARAFSANSLGNAIESLYRELLARATTHRRTAEPSAR